MEISACPACESKDIRFERTEVTTYPLESWRSGEERPVFVAFKESSGSEVSERIVCVNGHAHPDRIGFDLEWT